MAARPGDASGPEGIASLRWWDSAFKGDKRRAEACSRWLTRAMVRHDVRRRAALFNAQLYEDVPALGLGPYQYSVFDLGVDRLRMNLIRAVTNTYVSMISRSKPKPRVLTSDGNWTLKKRAKGMSRWGEAKADELSLYEDVSGPCCLDSGVFGCGLAKVYTEWPDKPELMDVGVERVFPWELIADDAESQIRKRMRSLAHRKWYDRQVAMEMFPGSKREIAQASRNDGKSSMRDWTADSAADLVPIFELWHLPTYPDAGDGLHIIMIEGKILFEGEWDRMRFPFAMLYRDKPTMGLYGTSIPHELRGIHVDVNQTLADMQECLRLNGKPRVLVPMGSIEKDAWDDDVDSIVEYTGQTPPFIYSPQVMPPEQYQFLWAKWAKGFEIIGTSQERSQGQVPEGLSGSGASIRAWNDVEDGRMYQPSQNYQDWHMELFDLMFEEGRAIAKVRPSYASSYRGKTTVQIVKFRDVDPGKDKYFLKSFPESRLSKGLSQRQAQLQELLNSGVISPAEFREQLDYPDLEAEDNLANAPRQLAEFLVCRMLEADDPDENDPEVFQYPEPDWPLALLRDRVQSAIPQTVIDGVPDGNVRLLRLFIQLCDQLIVRASQPAPGPPGAPVPGGAPLATPPGMVGPPGAPQLAAAPPPLASTMPGQAA